MKVPEPRKLKSGTWFIQMRLNGVSVPVSAATKTECINQARLIKSEYKAGKREIKYGKPDITLSTAIDNYIENKRNVLSPSTIRGYKTIKANNFKSVSDSTLKSISNWQSIIDSESKTHSPKTVKNAWGFVASVLRENGITPPKVTLPQDVWKEKAFLEPEDAHRFIETVKTESCAIPAMLGLCSLRKSEMLALTWENIDLKNEIIHVRGAAVLDENGKLIQKKTNKNSSSRRDVPIMIPELLDLLKAVPEKDRHGLLITCNQNTIYKRIKSFCDNNGFPNLGVHGLRHSFASIAFSSDVGMTEREVMEIAGWDDYRTVHKIYEHLARKNRLKAENKMKQFFKKSNQKNQNANENHNGDAI